MVAASFSCLLRPGDLVNQKYQIIEELGVGGFGAVYAAQNLNLGTSVAIKVRHSAGPDSRLRREAQLAASLRSPHSVRIFDVDCLPNGSAFIVMELLEGETLRDYLRKHDKVPQGLAVEWTLQICTVLNEAHAMGLIHLDIKPSNLFLVRSANVEPHLKLVDFGLAKSLVKDGPEPVTDSDVLVGSPAYMAPERVRGSSIGPASDIWSVGVVLFEMLTGELPFVGSSKSAMLAAIAADPPRALRELAPDASPMLGNVVARCLRKRPEDRFLSIAELTNALRRLHEPALLESGFEHSSTLSAALEPAARAPASVHRRRWGLALLALSMVCALAWLSQKAVGSNGRTALDHSTQTSTTHPVTPSAQPQRMLAGESPPPVIDTQPTPPAPSIRSATGSSSAVRRSRIGQPRKAAPEAPVDPPSAPGLFREPDF